MAQGLFPHPLSLIASFALAIMLIWILSPASLWPSPRPQIHTVSTGNAPWIFTPSLHSDSHTLTADQCFVAFGNLFQSINSAAERRGQRKVQLSDLETPDGRCMIRALIYDGELFVVNAGAPEKCYVLNLRERILATLLQIDKAVTSSQEPVPNIEFAISLDDIPRRSKRDGVFWGLTRQDNEAYADQWLMPDYGFWSWQGARIPSYKRLREQLSAQEKESVWSHKVDKAVWRGRRDASPIRGKLIDISHGKSWSDIESTDISVKDSTNIKTVPEMCSYKFVIQTEGTSYSGRLKYLQLCKSVVIAHKLEWQEFHTHLLRPEGPEQNFIQTREDWMDLDEKIKYYLENPAAAAEIADRSYDMFASRYLTPAAVTCYWRRLFQAWADLQAFSPSPYVETSNGTLELRATPFTKFVVAWPEDPTQIP